VAKIINKPATQEIGQKVAERLANRIAARLIRTLLVEENYSEYISLKSQPTLPATTIR
jgi:hypothetical protein